MCSSGGLTSTLRALFESGAQRLLRVRRVLHRPFAVLMANTGFLVIAPILSHLVPARYDRRVRSRTPLTSDRRHLRLALDGGYDGQIEGLTPLRPLFEDR